MDVREKLVELIKNGVPCPDGRDPFGEYCDTCRYSESADCSNERLADYLISHGVTVQGWISVKDRLPDWRDGKVLVFTKYGFSICERTVNNRWRGQHANWITHWTYLPQPPKGE